ncbi:MAG: AI-2E family transporter [Paracoccaceae bacterium]|nr:AI-2E family transporter [Paracoccaceae bacterium]
MALPVRDQLRYWTIATIAFVAVMWFLGDVLLPFVLGGAIAYCLDPVADRLERIGLSRTMATVVITIAALILFVVGGLLVVPTLAQQAADLFALAPELARQLQAWVNEQFPQIMDESSTIRRSLDSLGATIQAKGGEFLNGVLTSALSLLNIVVLIVLVPVVTFYLLLDWDNMVAKIDDLLPRDHAPAIRQIASDIDATLAAFIRGQGTVCVILGVYYATLLAIVGLQFGLVVGAVAGLISFIPYVGALVGGVLAIGLALFQFWGDWIWILAVWAIFQSGQFLEGNILTPKLVGSSVGLHPVWLIFALSVFGALFGFVGLLVAVPVAAAIGVVARFFIEQYREGLLYKGLSGREPPAELEVEDEA